MKSLLPSLGQSTNDFINNSKSRPISEILDEADMIGRMIFTLERFEPIKSPSVDIREFIDRSTLFCIDRAFCWLLFSDFQSDRTNSDHFYFVRKFRERIQKEKIEQNNTFPIINSTKFQYGLIDSSRRLSNQDFLT
jgi:hypothetical protein